MTRGEKVLVALALLCVAIAPLATPILRSRIGAWLSPRLAVALVEWPSETDPWGRPWNGWTMNPESEMYRKQVTWSSGPDGIDQGGGGDDVLIRDRPTECPAWPSLSHPGIEAVSVGKDRPELLWSSLAVSRGSSIEHFRRIVLNEAGVPFNKRDTGPLDLTDEGQLADPNWTTTSH